MPLALPTQPPPTGDDAVARTLGIQRPRRRWAGWLVGAALIAAAIAAGAWWRGRQAEGRWTWETATVESGDLTVVVTAVGTLEPVDAVDISSDVSGIVREVTVETGDRVKAGQVLARLDTDLLRAQVRQAEAQVAAGKAAIRQAEVSLKAARQERDRSRALSGAAAVSAASQEQAESAYDQAEASLSLAKAQLAQSSAALDVARTNLSRAAIHAPIDGVVLSRNVDPGQTVVSSLQAATLFQVARDLTRMQVEVQVDEADVGRVQPGQKATFTVPAWPERVFDAQVTKVELAPIPTSQVVTYQATLAVDNADGRLRPGLTATVEVEAERLTGELLVPTAALRFDMPESDLPPPSARAGRRVGRVWVLDGEAPSPLEIVTGASDGRRAVVEEGDLAPGATVVTAAIPRRSP